MCAQGHAPACAWTFCLLLDFDAHVCRHACQHACTYVHRKACMYGMAKVHVLARVHALVLCCTCMLSCVRMRMLSHTRVHTPGTCRALSLCMLTLPTLLSSMLLERGMWSPDVTLAKLTYAYVTQSLSLNHFKLFPRFNPPKPIHDLLSLPLLIIPSHTYLIAICWL